MKKLALLSLSLILSFSAQAQWWGSNKVRGNGKISTITRETEDYDIISVGGSFEVFLVSGTEGSIALEAEENLLDLIETEVRGNTLKIKIKDGTNLTSTKGMKVTVPFKDLEEIHLAGSGEITGKAPVYAEQFKTSVSGSGDLQLEVEAEEIEAKVSGSGNLNLSGKAQRVSYNVSGSGNLNAGDLSAKDADVSSVGSGNVRLVCDGGMLKARAVGSGNIKYSGKPNKEDFKVLGSGKVSGY